MENLVSIKQAAEYLHVSQDTLRKWEKSKKIKSHKTPGGHRRYDINELNDFIDKTPNRHENLTCAVYIKLSYENELNNAIEKINEYCINQNKNINNIFKDINGTTELEKLIELIIKRKINKVFLLNFEINSIVEKIFKTCNCEFEIIK